MTAKEKANYLYDKCYLTTRGRVDSGFDAKDLSKECALLCVDESLNVFFAIHRKLVLSHLVKGSVVDTETYAYWMDVKKEIELL